MQVDISLLWKIRVMLGRIFNMPMEMACSTVYINGKMHITMCLKTSPNRAVALAQIEVGKQGMMNHIRQCQETLDRFEAFSPNATIDDVPHGTIPFEEA